MTEPEKLNTTLQKFRDKNGDHIPDGYTFMHVSRTDFVQTYQAGDVAGIGIIQVFFKSVGSTGNNHPFRLLNRTDAEHREFSEMLFRNIKKEAPVDSLFDIDDESGIDAEMASELHRETITEDSTPGNNTDNIISNEPNVDQPQDDEHCIICGEKLMRFGNPDDICHLCKDEKNR